MSLRATSSAFALIFALGACQMDGGVPPMDFAAIQAERLAKTLAIVETCRASECGRLNLDSGLLEDFSALSDMTHVNALMMSFTDFDDLGAIAAMSQLTELHFGQTQVTDLSPLTNFPNLTLLHAQGLNVTDYSALASLTRLEELIVGENDLSDLGFARSLSRLKVLSINGSNVTDLSPLAGLRNLETLEMMSMDLPDDLSPLLQMRGLKRVSASDWTTRTPQQQRVIDALTARGVIFDVQMMIVAC